jgi:23S rRNA pseudouridine2605 synthase
MIEEGRVELNGKPAKLGDRYKQGDRIKVNGKLVNQSSLAQKRAKVLIYHKPVGELCTRNDPEGRPTIFDNLPKLHNGRWVTVGRLDINTSGLLIVTTDGALANGLMHPSNEVEREYAVRVLGEVNMDVINNLRQGVELEDGMAHFDDILDSGGSGANHWYHVVLKEGRNREVRRLWESQGIKVSRLTRVRYGTIALPKGLRPGKWQDLSETEVRSLRRLIKKKKDSEKKSA